MEKDRAPHDDHSREPMSPGMLLTREASREASKLAGNQPGFSRKYVWLLLEDLIQSICSCRIYMRIFQEEAFSCGKTFY